jgi:hypothetical protein
MSAPNYLIYFITGNPGISAYYKPFFDALDCLITPSSPTPDTPTFHLATQDFLQFADDPPLAFLPKGPNHPASLEDQIAYTVSNVVSTVTSSSKPYSGIFVIGHSVGAYVLLELLRRLPAHPAYETLPPVLAGICLFPTVTHIAQSPNGVRISALFHIPHFPWIASVVAKGLVWPIPAGALKRLVKMVTGMSEEAAGITVGFLKSRMGVLEAL